MPKKKRSDKTTRMFHLTNSDNMTSVRKNGIRASQDGYIYMYTDQRVAGRIAQLQCGLIDFAEFEILPGGITAEVEPDNVAELTAPYQRRIKQEVVSPAYLKFVNCYTVEGCPRTGER